MKYTAQSTAAETLQSRAALPLTFVRSPRLSLSARRKAIEVVDGAGLVSGTQWPSQRITLRTTRVTRLTDGVSRKSRPQSTNRQKG